MSVGWEEAGKRKALPKGHVSSFQYVPAPLFSIPVTEHRLCGLLNRRLSSDEIRGCGLLSELNSKWASLLTPGCFPAGLTQMTSALLTPAVFPSGQTERCIQAPLWTLKLGEWVQRICACNLKGFKKNPAGNNYLPPKKSQDKTKPEKTSKPFGKLLRRERGQGEACPIAFCFCRAGSL